MTSNAPTAPRQKPANISDPPKFSRKREDLEGLKNMINVKLTGNAEQFPSDQHCLGYVYGQLEGNALAQVQAYITETGITLTNVVALLEILQTAFGDPDVQGTATRELRKLRQLNKEFSTYVAEFMSVKTLGARTPASQPLSFSFLSRYAFPRFFPLLVILGMVRVATQQLLSHIHVTHARVSNTW